MVTNCLLNVLFKCLIVVRITGMINKGRHIKNLISYYGMKLCSVSNKECQ